MKVSPVFTCSLLLSRVRRCHYFACFLKTANLR